ncbi:MAG: fibronectin type III domain-containing protein [Solirubrobacteraceae bacterium]
MTKFRAVLAAVVATGSVFAVLLMLGVPAWAAGPPIVNYASANPSQSTQSTQLLEAYVTPEGLDTHYQVEYGVTMAYGSSTQPVDMGVEPGGVTQELTGLQAATMYHFRLLAVNAAGTSYSPDGTFTTQPVAYIASESISEAGTSEVTLNVRVDDFGASSTFYFEYGPTDQYGRSTKEEVLSSGEVSSAQARVGGLTQDSKYHFRVVVRNQYGTIRGSDYDFSTSSTPSLALPDDRRYEKVSQSGDPKGNVIPQAPSGMSFESDWSFQPLLAAADGDAIAYMGDPSETGGTGNEGAGAGNQYLARRGGESTWTATNIEPDVGVATVGSGYQGFTKNLEDGFLIYNGSEPLATGAPADKYPVLYARDLNTRVFAPLFTETPPNREVEEFRAYHVPTLPGEPQGPAYAGSSTDLSHMFFMANDALVSGMVGGGPQENNLYDSHEGTLTPINVLPNRQSEPNATFGGPPGESFLGEPALSHAISENGHRVYWTDLNNGDLYLRENDATTVRVDASAGGEGVFWTATPDGSKALFIKQGDIYEYEAAGGHVVDLTPGGEVRGIVSTSEDLSYVYFVSGAALAPGAQSEECQYGESGCNLYVLHQGEAPRFIAMLAAGDDEEAVESENYGGGAAGDWQPGLGQKEAQATPDGRTLVFTSTRSLTGYSNVSREGGEPRNDEEVFVYDFAAAKLFCASCNPTNEAPKHPTSAFLPVTYMSTYSHRWISSDGKKVFFDSLDPLVPQDTNGLLDVYEWEQDGAGSCEATQGCVYLLSAGNSPEASFLADASESGHDVFFTTRSQLVPEDKNENVDLYDARANAPLPVVAPQCTGTGCQGIASAPPVFSTPSSVTYNGVGNFPASIGSNKAKAKKKVKKSQRKKGGKRKKHKRATHRAVKSARQPVKGHRGSK